MIMAQQMIKIQGVEIPEDVYNISAIPTSIVNNIIINVLDDNVPEMLTDAIFLLLLTKKACDEQSETQMNQIDAITKFIKDNVKEG